MSITDKRKGPALSYIIWDKQEKEKPEASIGSCPPLHHSLLPSSFSSDEEFICGWGGAFIFALFSLLFPLPKSDFTSLQNINTGIHPTLTSGTLCIPRPVRTHSTLLLWWLATAKWSHLPALKSGYWQKLDECKEHKAFLQLHWAGKRWTTFTRLYENRCRRHLLY